MNEVRSRSLKGEYSALASLKSLAEDYLRNAILPDDYTYAGYDHRLHQINKSTLAVLRQDEAGSKELLAYEINDRLGRPIWIPFTVPYADGSLQLWFKSNLRPSRTLTQKMEQLTRNNGDLQIFSFLILNWDVHSDNWKMDDLGGVYYDFDIAFATWPTALREYFDYSREYFGYPPVPQNLKPSDIEYRLRMSLLKSKFDWKFALNNCDDQDISRLISLRLGPHSDHSGFANRLCALRAVVNNQRLSQCHGLDKN